MKSIWAAWAGVAIAVGGSIVLLAYGGFVGRIIGFASLITTMYASAGSVVEIGSRLPRFARSTAVREGLPPVLLVLVVAGLLWPLLLGDMPYPRDHPVHLTRAWILVERMLFEGRLKGWTDIWFAGYPYGEDYPIGADLWVAAFYLGTFGLLGWVASYGIAFFSAYCVIGLSAYSLARVHFGRLAGFFAGLFTVADAGFGLEGGWHYTVEAGVWPQAFGTAWAMLTLSMFPRLIERGAPRDWALVAICFGYAVVSHPFSVIWLGLAVPTYLSIRSLVGADGTFGATWIRPVGACALGAALASFWVVPFASKADWMHTAFGDMWLSLADAAPQLVSGTVFGGLFPPLFFLGVAGGVLAWVRRSFGGIWLFVLGALALLLMTRDLVVETDLMEAFPGLGRLQYERFAYIGRPCAFLLAGYALSSVWLGPRDRSGGPRWRRVGLVLVVSAAIAPFAFPVAQHWWGQYRPGKGFLTTETSPDWSDYQDFLRWSRHEAKSADSFFRIAYSDLNTGHLLSSAPVFNQVPAVRTDFTPATTFRFKPARFDVELFEALNVKYVLSVEPLGFGFREVRRFGRLILYRFERYSSRRITVVGAGEVTDEVVDPEHGFIRFRLRGADASTRVIVHVANFANWSATRDGTPLSIRSAALADWDGFIGLPGDDGTIVVRYGMTAADWVGALLSFGAGLVVVILLFARRLPATTARVTARIQRIVERFERRAVWLVAGFLAAPLLYVTATLAGLPPPAGRSFVSQLDRASASVATESGVEPCPRASGSRFQCGQENWNYAGRHYLWMMDEDGYHAGDGRMRRCIWMHADPKGELRLTFPAITLGEHLVGGHGLTNYGPRPMALVAYADGVELGRVPFHRVQRWTEWRIDTASQQGRTVDLTFGILVPEMGPYQYCWNGRVER